MYSKKVLNGRGGNTLESEALSKRAKSQRETSEKRKNTTTGKRARAVSGRGWEGSASSTKFPYRKLNKGREVATKGWPVVGPSRVFETLDFCPHSAVSGSCRARGSHSPLASRMSTSKRPRAGASRWRRSNRDGAKNRGKTRRGKRRSGRAHGG